MKIRFRTVLFGLGLIGVLLLIIMKSQPSQEAQTNPTSHKSEQKNIISPVQPFNGPLKETVFVPYWNIPSQEDVADYDRLIYFGVAPDSEGNIVPDAGSEELSRFIKLNSSSKETLLTVRMLNTETNTAVLENTQAQRVLIENVSNLMSEYNFDGIVLDLEYSALPSSKTETQITEFVRIFSAEIRSTNTQSGKATFHMAVYGDTFYRKRPYDIQTLGEVVDGIFIMAYDFHKSRGEPGPNFPLTRRSVSEGGQDIDYGYDFKTMIADFTSVVPPKKITVLFGMYGYDWTLGPQGLPLKSAKAVPLREIDSKGAIVDPESKEKYVIYQHKEGFEHELWYEDFESVEVKKEFMKNHGIGSAGYWVWGYW